MPEPNWQGYELSAGSDRRDVYALGDEEQLLALRREGTLAMLRDPSPYAGAMIPLSFWRLVQGSRSAWQRIEGIPGAHRLKEELEAYLPRLQDAVDAGLRRMPRDGAGKAIVFGFDEALTFDDEGLPIGLAAHAIDEGEAKGATGISLSCAACHSSNLFGRHVPGLPNKMMNIHPLVDTLLRGRGGALAFGQGMLGRVNDLLATLRRRNRGEDAPLLAELRLLQRTLEDLRYVQTLPAQPGLDSALNAVALSLARRQDDARATRTPESLRSPRDNALSTQRMDSKPPAWFILRYFTRFMHDASFVGANPVLVNFVNSHLGLGADITPLYAWYEREENKRSLQALTAAIFATPAPRYQDFITHAPIDSAKAERGKGLYAERCAHCHGDYRARSGCEQAGSGQPPTLFYPPQPARIDVGSDPSRWQGMRAYAAEAKRVDYLGTRYAIESAPEPRSTDRGYRRTPLVSVWSTYPYFHNGSCPNLCCVLASEGEESSDPRFQRQSYQRFFAVEPKDPVRDFDSECVGFPAPDTLAAERRLARYEYRVGEPGLSNAGHDFAKGLSTDERLALIEFLKSL